MKKILAIVLVAAMLVFCLTACNSGKTSDAIKIGGTGPLTGGAAIYGNAVKNGASIAVEEVNALGGLKFELRYEDDVHDPEKAVTAYNTLKDWGMQISLGSVTTKPAVATSAEANNDKMFYLTPSASSPDVLGGVANPLTGTVEIERKPSIYQLCFSDPNQGLASANYIANKKLGTKIAVIYKNDDVYSTGIYNSFKAEAEKLNLNIVSTTTFTDDTSVDFSVQIADAKKAGADLVFLPMYYEAASQILIQANAAEYDPTWFGVDGMDGILTLEGFDKELAEDVILLTPFNADSEDEKTAKFVKTYKEKYGEIPNQFAADAYDCVWAIYNALKDNKNVSSKTTASEFCTILTEKFSSKDFSYDGITGEGMTWSESGAVTKAPKGMVIKNGAYVGLD